MASVIDIPKGVAVCPLLVETKVFPTYCCLIDEFRLDDGLSWYDDIYQFLQYDTYPEAAITKDRRALRQLVFCFVICGESLYRCTVEGMLLLCLDRDSAYRVMREIHAEVYELHIRGHMLACKIMRTSYFWFTIETYCCQFVQRCL